MMRYFEGNDDTRLNRGLYLVKYIGKGRQDKPKNPILYIEKGCCKFGQSQALDKVEERYINHFKPEEKVIEMHILARLRDRDDIYQIEKKMHEAFKSRRLINDNNRMSEWMQPDDIRALKKEFKSVFLQHFSVK